MLWDWGAPGPLGYGVFVERMEGQWGREVQGRSQGWPLLGEQDVSRPRGCGHPVGLAAWASQVLPGPCVNRNLTIFLLPWSHVSSSHPLSGKQR